jgi:hypothetical protein
MVCSLVAWEEEEDWRCLVTSVESATSTSGRGRVVVPSPKQVATRC